MDGSGLQPPTDAGQAARPPCDFRDPNDSHVTRESGLGASLLEMQLLRQKDSLSELRHDHVDDGDDGDNGPH